MLSTSVGVARRVQVAATLPISSVHYPDGFNTHGLGDAYFSAKVGVRTSDRGVGVAVSPVVEVLSDGSWPTPDGGTIGRVHWALPINLEYRGRGWRTYGSAGYFSRGAVFGSGTVDIGVGPRAGVLGLLSHSVLDARSARRHRHRRQPIAHGRERRPVCASASFDLAVRAGGPDPVDDRRLRVEVLCRGGRVRPRGPGGQSHAVDRAAAGGWSRSLCRDNTVATVRRQCRALQSPASSLRTRAPALTCRRAAD